MHEAPARTLMYAMTEPIYPSPPVKRTLPGRAPAAILCAACAAAVLSCSGLPGRRTDVPNRLGKAEGPILMFAPGAHNRLGPTDSSVMIWHFSPRGLPRRERIRYWKENDPGTVFTAKKMRCFDRRMGRFVLKGLAPDTPYRYEAPAGNARSFVTGPDPSRRAQFRVLALGDTGSTLDGESHFSYYGDILAAAGELYERKAMRPAFLLHLGDLVRRGSDPVAWKEFLDTTSANQFTGPVVMVPGNHEMWGDRGAAFRYFTGRPLYYSFEYGGALFLCINALDGRRGRSHAPLTGRAQYRFVERELARWNGRGWCVVVIHNPILSTGDFGVSASLSSQYLELFRRHRVDLVLSGHDHIFDSFHRDRRTDWGGTLFVVAGTGGSKLDHYIMTREKRRWRSWKNRGRRCDGLEPGRKDVSRTHVYGEISWGFADVAFGTDSIEVTYYRWLSLPRFLRVTGQTGDAWRMTPLDEKDRAALKASPAARIRKTRSFPPSGGGLTR